MTTEQMRAWKFFRLSLGISTTLVFGVAYLIPNGNAELLVDWLRNSMTMPIAERYLSRFASYASPANGMLGLLACWLCAPFLLAAGFRFAAEIVRTSGPRLQQRSRLVVRAVVGLTMFGVLGFTTFVLAGTPPARCRGCEAEPMFLMLVVSIVGAVVSGAMLGFAVSDIRAALKIQSH